MKDTENAEIRKKKPTTFEMLKVNYLFDKKNKQKKKKKKFTHIFDISVEAIYVTEHTLYPTW